MFPKHYEFFTMKHYLNQKIKYNTLNAIQEDSQMITYGMKNDT